MPSVECFAFIVTALPMVNIVIMLHDFVPHAGTIRCLCPPWIMLLSKRCTVLLSVLCGELPG
jgi:hypothetical protein